MSVVLRRSRVLGNTVATQTGSSTPGPTNQRNGAAARVCMKALERSTKAGRRNIDHLPDLAQRRKRRNEFLKIDMADRYPARPGRPAHHTSRLRFGRREACSKNHAERRVSRQPVKECDYRASVPAKAKTEPSPAVPLTPVQIVDLGDCIHLATATIAKADVFHARDNA